MSSMDIKMLLRFQEELDNADLAGIKTMLTEIIDILIDLIQK